jgi:hypothetical protein
MTLIHRQRRLTDDEVTFCTENGKRWPTGIGIGVGPRSIVQRRLSARGKLDA